MLVLAAQLKPLHLYADENAGNHGPDVRIQNPFGEGRQIILDVAVTNVDGQLRRKVVDVAVPLNSRFNEKIRKCEQVAIPQWL